MRETTKTRSMCCLVGNVLAGLILLASNAMTEASVKPVCSEIRPVTVQILQPCYRNTIYASQMLSSIKFSVNLAPNVREATVGMTYALCDANGAAIGEGQLTPAQIGQSVEVPFSRLTDGTYTLTVNARDAQASTIAETAQTIRKLPPPTSGNEVRINKNRQILINGEPFFGIGWYGGLAVDDRNPEVRELQNLTTPVVIYPPDVSPIRTAYEKNRTYSIVSVENNRIYFSFDLWREDKKEFAHVREELTTLTKPSEDFKQFVKELVDCVRDEPGLLGYYIADEPEIHNIPSEYLEAFYAYLCELDPYHPVFLTNDTLDGLVTHGYRCADVLSPDPYADDWNYVPNFLKRILETAGPGKAIQATLWHSATDTHFTRPIGSSRPYPYRVFRNQYFASVCYGATGFTAYSSPFFLPEIEYRYGLPHVWRELRFLESAILAPPSVQEAVVEGATDLALMVRENAGYRYLIAVNHQPEPREVRIQWAPLGGIDTLSVMSEGRQVSVTGAAFTDRFAPGDVHIYTDDPRAATLPTTTAVEAELKLRTQDGIKPGNLLHWTRDVTVGCSDGYFSAWFNQYFYYVINGVEDDLGWYAHAWDKKNAWLELTLPEEADIGSIVLYTPNIRDYELQLTEADGVTVHRAMFTNNTQNRIVHNFKPGVRGLKIHISVTKVNPGEPGRGSPILSEIEAYTEPRTDGEMTPLATEKDDVETVPPQFTNLEGESVLWKDDFKTFEWAPHYEANGENTKWILNPDTFLAEPLEDGRIRVSSHNPKENGSSMSHIFPYDPAYRFLQVKLDSIEGVGYQFAYVHLGSGSGLPGYRRAINTSRPGIYTIDTHYVHENLRTGKDKHCLVMVYAAGVQKHSDGTVESGPRFTYDTISLSKSPRNGLAVTLDDGQPLPDVLTIEDTLVFELSLDDPAADAMVKLLAGSAYAPIPINGEPYIKLRRSDDTGRTWTGKVVLGAGTGTVKKSAYPLVFQAAITGGTLKETYMSATLSILP